jgi:uncharacterized membrane protein
MGAIDDIELARVIHVLCIVHWIGGVAFVTLVALPVARAASEAREGWELFARLERRFSAQVRISIPLAGASGLWMSYRLDLWYRFSVPSFWWMGAMAALWALFLFVVFVVEPLIGGRLEAEAARNPRAVLARLARGHLALLALAVVTVFGAVAGSHGGF